MFVKYFLITVIPQHEPPEPRAGYRPLRHTRDWRAGGKKINELQPFVIRPTVAYSSRLRHTLLSESIVCINEGHFDIVWWI